MINILICLDDNLTNYVPTLLNSISLNNKRCRVIAVLSEPYFQREYILEYCPTNIDIEFIEFKPIISTHESNYNKINCKVNSTMMFSRIFAEKLLPDIDKIIYIDIDTIVDGNLQSLFDMETGECGLAACPDFIAKNFNRMMRPDDYIVGKCIVDYDVNTPAFNSGVLLMDLKKLRKNNACEYMYDIISKQYMTDQPLLNLYSNGRFKQLEMRYNYPANWDNRVGDYKINCLKNNNKIVIYHWNGPKAWDNKARYNQDKYDEYKIRKKERNFKRILQSELLT